jgi:uncharacterized protein
MTRLIGLALIAAGLAVGVTAARAAFSPQAADCSTQPFAEAQLPGSPRLQLELATTPEQQQRGLMFRQSLPDDQGMLFVFQRPSTAPFWMHNTLIPLSIAYIDGDGTIVDIQDMQPQSDDLHPPARPYSYALEVNQGWYANNGVAVGNVFAFCLPAA